MGYSYLPVSIMHICTGCQTGENLPNSTILSCNLRLLYRPSKSLVKEVLLNDICPHCSWSPTPSSFISWLLEVQLLWNPLVVHSKEMAKPLQSAISDDILQLGLFRQSSYVLICDKLGPNNQQDLTLASHIKGI